MRATEGPGVALHSVAEVLVRYLVLLRISLSGYKQKESGLTLSPFCVGVLLCPFWPVRYGQQEWDWVVVTLGYVDGLGGSRQSLFFSLLVNLSPIWSIKCGGMLKVI